MEDSNCQQNYEFYKEKGMKGGTSITTNRTRKNNHENKMGIKEERTDRWEHSLQDVMCIKGMPTDPRN